MGTTQIIPYIKVQPVALTLTQTYLFLLCKKIIVYYTGIQLDITLKWNVNKLVFDCLTL